MHLRRPYIYGIILFLFVILPISPSKAHTLYDERFALYKKTELMTKVPWYYLAAIDQYERNIQSDHEDELIAITFPETVWYGPGNVSKDDHLTAITFFNGIGRDGNKNGRATHHDPEDRLYTTARLLAKNGLTEDDFKISLWQHYQRDLTVKTIVNIAKIYKHFQTNELSERHFPVAIEHNYSYRSTWGHRRGFGGNRIHEGTDIFANYGTPVLATTYGIVELKGWNLYGGWRIGIRDIHNIYHYYAHLNGYEDQIAIGDIVKPGDLLGTVGSTGYGPPGTAGKFPPHLHYGMYKDNGHNEWSFDPYPYLRRWEQETKEQK